MSAPVESFSIWLMPRGKLATQLQAEIDRLAEQHSAPRFAPHVTLLGDIQGTREEVVAKAEQLAKDIKKYPIEFLRVARGSLFFQCVYLLCATNSPTMAAAAAARTLYGLDPAQPYMPHLSLLYSDIDEATREGVVAEEHARLYGESSGYASLLVEPGFTVHALSVWRTPTGDASLACWEQVAEVTLAD